MTFPEKVTASEVPLITSEIILERISEVALQMQHGAPLEDILQGAIAAARATLQTDRVLIYRVLPNQDAVVAYESVGQAWKPILGQLIYDPCLQATWVERYQQGQVTQISDLYSGQIPTCHVNLLEGLQVQANLVVPILSQNQLWGLLIAHHCRSPRAWQPIAVQYLQQVALHLGLAIQQADLRQPPQPSPGAHSHAHSQADWLRHYERIVSATPDCVSFIDRDYIYQVVNHTYLNWHQKSQDEIVGHSVSDLLGQDFFEQICKPDLDRCLAGEAQQSIEAWFDYPDGERRYTRATYTPYVETDGTISGVVINIHDLTALKQAELSHQANEQKYRHLVENMQAGLVVHGPDTQILQCNPSACDLLGLSMDELLGKTAIDSTWHFLREDGTTMPFEEYPVNQVLATQTSLRNQVLGINRADQSKKWVLVTAFPEFDPEGLLVQIVVTFVDITNRKQAELALEKELLLSKALFNTSIDGIVLLDHKGNVLQASASFAKMLGYTSEETLTLNLLDWDAQWSRAELHKILQGTIPLPPCFETRHRRKDGSVYDVEISYSQEILNGETVHFCGCRDISDRKAAEQQLKDLSNRLNLAVQSAEIGIWDWDIVNDRLIWDDRMYKLYGIQPDDFGGAYQTWESALHPDDLAKGKQAIQKALAGEQDFDLEFRGVWPDGSIHYIEAHSLVERDADDRPLRMIGMNIDISDRKQAEHKLRLQSAALEACADIIVITDAKANIEWANPAFTQVTGYSLEEAVGKNPGDLVKSGHHDFTFYQDLWKTILTGNTWRGELINRRKDGSLYHEFATITPIRDPDHRITHFIAIKQDITERKQLEQIERQQLERERVLHQISQHIRQSLDLDQILNTAVAEVRQFLQTDRVVIYRFNPDRSGVIVAESVAEGWSSILDMVIADTWFVSNPDNFLTQGEIKAREDIYTENSEPCYIEFLEQLQVRAKLTVPILQGQHLWGILVAHHCQSPRLWQPLEIELQRQLATQLAIAIQQSELYQQVQTLNTNLEGQVQERTRELQQALDFEALLKRITDRVRDSLDEAEILQHVVKELATALKADCCDTAIYNAERTATTVKCEYNQGDAIAQNSPLTISDSSDPHLYLQLFQGHCCHFCLLRKNVARPHQPHEAILAVPIIDDQGILGDLWLFRPAQAAFDEQEIRLVQQVANQCAIALRQAKLYQTAQSQVQELARLNQLKDDFLSTVSHELRTPMASIKMATQMIEISLQQMGTFDDQAHPIHRYFKVLHDEEQREINLINDLLDLARLDAGTEALNLTEIDLQIYIPHLVEPFIDRAKRQQQQFVLQIPADLPSVTTDLNFLERILTELFQNACKYTPAHETITISAQTLSAQTIDQTADQTADQTPKHSLEIRVSNSGVELPPEECDRIFDKFYRIPNNDPWKHGGTGLGLALVKKISEQLGGTIAVTSGDRQTTFILTLPSC